MANLNILQKEKHNSMVHVHVVTERKNLICALIEF